MIGAGLHGNGRHWYNVEPEERVIAMKVRQACYNPPSSLIFELTRSPDDSIGGCVKLDFALHQFFAKFQSAFS